jgi:DNA-binding response OmpR family regulator
VAQTDVARKGSILVVEDQTDIQMTLRLSLEVDGYDVAVASDGREALSAIEHSTPDLVLLDITLPEMSGWDLLSRLRAEERFASLPVIVLSALPPEKVSLRARELGATGYLIKPFDVALLAETVRGALEDGRTS